MFELALFPIVPDRLPHQSCRNVECGFGLRTPEGFALRRTDPMLAALGVVVAHVHSAHCEETLQGDEAGPGRRVLILPSADGDPGEVSVWSADGVALLGLVEGDEGEQLEAALDLGLALEAVVLEEFCEAATGRRCAVSVVVFPSSLVRLTVPDVVPLRPARNERPRLVLVADARAHLDLWDPSGGHGPLDVAELGVSDGLRERLERLRELLATRPDVVGADPTDLLLAGWGQEAMDAELRAVWQRLRAELGRRCDVGLQGPGDAAPVWHRAEPVEAEEEDEDDGLPF